MRCLNGVCWFLCLGSLAGCGNGTDVQALEARLHAIRQQVPALLEEPVVAVVGPRFVYDPALLRDPFQLPNEVHPVSRPSGRPGLKPDSDRPRQFLEGFAVDEFEMVGTLSSGAQTFVLLRGAAGVHRLAVGDYLGWDHGRVMAIHEDQIEIVELFPDGEGAWLERSRTLALNVHS